MRTTLTAHFQVEHIAIFAEMACFERRSELGLLCRNALEDGNKLTVTGVQSILPGVSDTGVKNIILWCKQLGLFNQSDYITDLGKNVAETNEAPLPEQGVYELWFAQHDLIGPRILAFKRLGANDCKLSTEERYDFMKPLEILSDIDEKKVFCSVLDPKERFLFRKFFFNQKKAYGVFDDKKTTCQVSWTIDFNESKSYWHIIGELETESAKKRPIVHNPEADDISHEALISEWADLYLRKFGRWEAQKKMLAVNFTGISEHELKSFKKTLSLGNVEIKGKGSYTDVKLEDVPICPDTKESAQKWAIARLEKCILEKQGYRSRSTLRQEFIEQIEGTPLEEFSPILPGHLDILKDKVKNRSLFWSLAAPVDLCPYTLGEEELGPFHNRSETISTEDVSERSIRAPIGCKWSMKEFVNRISHNQKPSRVLLCDRYVRGTNNLESLKLLVDALKSANPTVSIDTWTGDEAEDFKKILDITGKQPSGYGKIFGQKRPHDRYLLIVTNTGEEICWQMSNSPLHAKPITKGSSLETPLRWNDFTAISLSSEELISQFLNWIKGKSL